MITIFDTYLQIDTLFENEMFNRDKWVLYINSIYDNSANIFINDLQECLDNGNYVYEMIMQSLIQGYEKFKGTPLQGMLAFAG